MSIFHPYKLSPVHHSLEELGARWMTITGWRVPASFGSPVTEVRSISTTVGLGDVSFQGKIEFSGSELERVLPSLLAIDSLPAVGYGHVTSPDDFKTAYRIRHDQLLVCGASDDEIARLLRINETEGCVHATERTSGLTSFLLVGPRAVEVLNRVTSLNLHDTAFPDLRCARTPLAHVNALIVRRDRKQLRAYEVFVGREHGEYAWHAIWEMGEQFGVTAFGQEAQLTLER